MLIPRFSVDALRRGLDAHASVLAGVPSMFRATIADPAFQAPGLRMILTGGEVLPKPLALAMQAMSPGAGLFDLYGVDRNRIVRFRGRGLSDLPEHLARSARRLRA